MNTFFPKTRGKFGTDCEKDWSVMLAMNLKGGIDERESRSYFLNSIASFEDIRGKRVIIKIDSGLCRMELWFLADERTSGVLFTQEY